jgi:hypothetical protein
VAGKPVMIEIIIEDSKYRVKGTDIAGTSIRPLPEVLHALAAAGVDRTAQIIVHALPASDIYRSPRGTIGPLGTRSNAGLGGRRISLGNMATKKFPSRNEVGPHTPAE